VRALAAHAERNYATAQSRFDAIAADFVAAANTVEVEADAASLYTAGDEQRTAWTRAATLATQLDATLPVLVLAAELAGVHPNNEDRSLLTLAVSPVDMGRRELWAAWETTDGRTHRWGALHRLGATIRAAALGDAVPYRRPRELEHRLTPTNRYGVYETTIHDPESPGYQPPAEPERAMIPGGRVFIR
jgi:hypothetical protein